MSIKFETREKERAKRKGRTKKKLMANLFSKMSYYIHSHIKHLFVCKFNFRLRKFIPTIKTRDENSLVWVREGKRPRRTNKQMRNGERENRKQRLCFQIYKLRVSTLTKYY